MADVAAVKIQSMYRGHLARGKVSSMHASATRIQSLARGKRDRNRVKHMRRNVASIKIQALARGNHDRKRVKKLREERKQTSVVDAGNNNNNNDNNDSNNNKNKKKIPNSGNGVGLGSTSDTLGPTQPVVSSNSNSGGPFLPKAPVGKSKKGGRYSNNLRKSTDRNTSTPGSVGTVSAWGFAPPAPPTAEGGSNNNGNQEKINLISIENFDEDNDVEPILTSPRSLQACQRLSIMPIELVRLPLQSFEAADVDPQTSRLRWHMHEQTRQELVLMVKRQREKSIMRQSTNSIVTASNLYPPPSSSTFQNTLDARSSKHRKYTDGTQSARESESARQQRRMETASPNLHQKSKDLEFYSQMRKEKDQMELERFETIEKRRLTNLFKEKLKQTELEESILLAQKEAERQRRAIIEAKLNVTVKNRLQSQLDAFVRLRNQDIEREMRAEHSMRKQIAKHTKALSRLQDQEKQWREQATRGKAESVMMTEWRRAFYEQQRMEQEQLARLQELAEEQRQRSQYAKMQARQRYQDLKNKMAMDKKDRHNQHMLNLMREDESKRNALESKLEESKFVANKQAALEERRKMDKLKAMRMLKLNLRQSVDAIDEAVRQYHHTGVLDQRVLPDAIIEHFGGAGNSSRESSPSKTMPPIANAHSNNNNLNNNNNTNNLNNSSMTNNNNQAWDDQNPEAVSIVRGKPMRSFVRAGEVRYFKVLVANPGVMVKVICKDLDGVTDIFVGNSNCPFPDRSNFTWQHYSDGEPLTIHRADPEFHEGYLYIAVSGRVDSWFVVVVKWTDRDRLRTAETKIRPAPVLNKIIDSFVSEKVRALPNDLQQKALDIAQTWR